ncbi:MAG: HAMP domain-containing histidine kinase [Phycisphaerae bacterium]|jgi:signal transduction histidine kinase
MTEAPVRDARGAARSDELSQVLHDCMLATERLQRTHETLQQEVARLRHELESKDRELERRRRLAALGELAAGMAHEVRNPLGAIQLYSGLLRSRCGDASAALELLEKIEAGIRAIDGVVQDTLALAPRGARMAPHVLLEIVQRAADTCTRVLELRRVRLEIEAADPAAQVLADAGALQRVLVNLIANAAEASAPDARIVVRVDAPRAGTVAIRVLDEGVGLPDGLADRIFDPFFTTKETGTGLGLTIAARLVELHGGTLTAANRDSGGAEFVIEIPAADAGQAGSKEAYGVGRSDAA